jgi:hypothetical protein
VNGKRGTEILLKLSNKTTLNVQEEKGNLKGITGSKRKGAT